MRLIGSGIDILETPTFSRHAAEVLSEVERKALYALLAQDPLAGEPSPMDEDIRVLNWRRDGSVCIEYVVAAAGKVFLVAVSSGGSADDKSTPVQDQDRIKELMDTARNSGIGWSVRELLETVRNLLGF